MVHYSRKNGLTSGKWFDPPEKWFGPPEKWFIIPLENGSLFRRKNGSLFQAKWFIIPLEKWFSIPGKWFIIPPENGSLFHRKMNHLKLISTNKWFLEVLFVNLSDSGSDKYHI